MFMVLCMGQDLVDLVDLVDIGIKIFGMLKIMGSQELPFLSSEDFNKMVVTSDFYVRYKYYCTGDAQ